MCRQYEGRYTYASSEKHCGRTPKERSADTGLQAIVRSRSRRDKKPRKTPLRSGGDKAASKRTHGAEVNLREGVRLLPVYSCN